MDDPPSTAFPQRYPHRVGPGRHLSLTKAQYRFGMSYPSEGDADEGDHGESYRRIWNHIDPKEVADLTLDLVRIPSPTGDELGVSEFYANALTEFGLEVQLNYVEDGRPNVFARIRGSGGGRSLLLHGHLDTVPIGGCTAPRIEGGRIYGRGSCDMRGSLAAMALAARRLLRAGARPRGDLILVGTVDHESPPGTGKGIRALVKKIKGEGIRVDGAINTEGPFDAIKVAQGGCAMFAITLTREGGMLYSATPPFSANPILWASELISSLAEMDAALERRRRHPLIPQRPTVQAGIIRGRDFLFSVPDSVRLEGAIRWDPGDEFGRVSEELRRLSASSREGSGRSMTPRSGSRQTYTSIGRNARHTATHR